MGICCSAPTDDHFDPPALRRIYANKKHGYYIGSYPWGLRSTTLKYVKLAEYEKGRPPYVTEVAQIMKRDSYWPVPTAQVARILV